MKILAVNGSPRPNGNTAVMLGWVLEELSAAGAEVETVQIGGQLVAGCKACGVCGQKKDRRCAQDKDPVNEIIAKMLEADGLILGSPVYFSDMTPELKALIDRAGFVTLMNGRLMDRKVGAAVVVARRAGHVHTYDSINHFFGISGMFTVGSTYWNLGMAMAPGEVNNDEEAKRTMAALGQNMAWILDKIHRAK
jgi:multimeric flavodoxin WrbA